MSPEEDPDFFPLLSPKPFGDYSPEGFRAYVKSLYREPPKPPPPAEWALRLNAKGNPVITVRRSPKWLSTEEVSAIAKELSWSLQRTWLHILGKKIEVRVPDVRTKKVR